MRGAALAFAATLAATQAMAGPLISRNNGGSKSVSTPWPAIPDPEQYTKPDGPVRAYPISVAKGVTSDHDNVELKLDNVGDTLTRSSPSAPRIALDLMRR